MLIKNKIFVIIILILNCFLFNFNIFAEELNITAGEITFEKDEEMMIAKGSVIIIDSDGNKVSTEKAEYDKIKDQVTTYDKSKVILKNGYEITSDKVLYDNKNKLIVSNNEANLIDPDGNLISVDMFEYLIKENLFSSRGKIIITDVNKNKYFFNEMYVDTKNKKIVGSDIRVSLNQENISGLVAENEPRLAANSAFISENRSEFINGILTTCKQRGEKCPPWTLQAKKISHDKLKKTIYYDSAVLKIYDVPLFYFPKFFHPDPTVQRQSGFLSPFFTSKASIGAGFALPYYWAVNHDKDLTFTPKIYSGHKSLFLTEYRQAFENSFLVMDTSYTAGYENPSGTQTSGSRNHFFAKFDMDLSKDDSYESIFKLNLQRVSNDTYFKIHNLDTALVDSENTSLKSDFQYNYKKDDVYFDMSASIYEDLTKLPTDRYEYILPNIEFGKSLVSSQSFGALDFKSQAFYNNFNTNSHNKFLINDFLWNSKNFFTKGGFLNTAEIQVKNTNYESKNDSSLKDSGGINEIAGVLAFRSALPMIKESLNYLNIFSPKAMLRFAPGHMKDLSTNDSQLSYSNLFSTNKTQETGVIESGTSAILGFDLSINEKKENENNYEKFSLSLGQTFNLENNFDLPSRSSLDQKMSDVVGEVNYNFSENSKIGYKFSLDHDLNTLNYNEISTELALGKVDFNLDYLEERNHIGNENYINTGITLNMNESNILTFETKKNFKTDSTEFYNLIYQYVNDCLTAGVEFNRTFYEDKDVEASDSLMFKISIKPFGGITTPSLYQ